ncbi:hypothetical protein [Bacillus sp. FJAT-47783]|uniref:hypothetical protein n=1 Tax=Bacillus sp. FJAT-47783 TaxID=2922712 RepID=UPI001FAE7182|nr:hypothetical protein [Bacillus sp. FJAT-47783]
MEHLLKSHILNANFAEASKLAKMMEVSKLNELLIELAFECSEDIIIYTFVCHLLIEQESEALHSLACGLLCHPFCHIGGAYKSALYHTRKALMLDPEHIGHKEMLLFFYEVPDLPDESITKEEALNIANQILEKEPHNQIAKDFIKNFA